MSNIAEYSLIFRANLNLIIEKTTVDAEYAILFDKALNRTSKQLTRSKLGPQTFDFCVVFAS